MHVVLTEIHHQSIELTWWIYNIKCVIRSSETSSVYHFTINPSAVCLCFIYNQIKRNNMLTKYSNGMVWQPVQHLKCSTLFTFERVYGGTRWNFVSFFLFKVGTFFTMSCLFSTTALLNGIKATYSGIKKKKTCSGVVSTCWHSTGHARIPPWCAHLHSLKSIYLYWCAIKALTKYCNVRICLACHSYSHACI